jgi:hypothetical protein
VHTFSPHLPDVRPCWHCSHYVAMIYAGTAARCARPDCAPVRSQPDRGCSAWTRETGTDDEPDAPLTDDPLAWQGRGARLPGYPPGCGLLYAWCEYERQPAANDERHAAATVAPGTPQADLPTA